jgi:hypothetical protein
MKQRIAEVEVDPDKWEEIGEDYQDLWDMTPAHYFIRRILNKRPCQARP